MLNTADRNRRFYDAEAAKYDEIRYSSESGKRVDDFHRSVLGQLAEMDIRNYSNALEVGCGTGRLLPFVSDHSEKVTGIDASNRMLGVARKRIEEGRFENIVVSEGDALNLDFADETFDLVYSILVINLIPDFVAVFNEVRRVLRPGGRFLFSVPNLDSIYYPAGRVVNSRGKAFGKNNSGHRYSHWFSRSEVDRALRQAGLVRKKTLGQPPWTGFVDGTRPLQDSKIGRWLSKSVYIAAEAT